MVDRTLAVSTAGRCSTTMTERDEAKLLRQAGDKGRGRQLLEPRGRGPRRELAGSGIGILRLRELRGTMMWSLIMT